jgi:hypothetical protein
MRLPSLLLSLVFALALLGALLALGAASAVELRDAELVAAGSPVLQNAAGTLRLEQGRLDAVGRRVFVVPEPGMLWQLGAGAGLLLFLARRRSRHPGKEDAAMKKLFRLRAPWIAVLLMCLAVPALAQVPQDMTYTGRLVNERGKALSGPVDLELRIFDAETSGTQLYSEQHLNEPLDASGGFSVQLGLGTSPSGPFDAGLFSEVDRWLEVVVDGEILTPRQIIGSVPWALVAERVASQGGPPGSSLSWFYGPDHIELGRVVSSLDAFNDELGLLVHWNPNGTLGSGKGAADLLFVEEGCQGQAYVNAKFAGDLIGPYGAPVPSRFYGARTTDAVYPTPTLSKYRFVEQDCSYTGPIYQLSVPADPVEEPLPFPEPIPLPIYIAPTLEPAP